MERKKTKGIDRRQFLKYSGLGVSALFLGACGSSGGGGAVPAGGGGGGGGTVVDTLNFTITDAMKEMVTHEPNSPLPSDARCYFWIFKEARFPAECPGPQIYAVEGDLINLVVTNELTSSHAFFIPGMVNTGAIAPGATFTGQFTVGAPGSYLYFDNLNAPVNRMMGLHGAFVSMPRAAAAGQKLTPYRTPTPAVQQLFNDFGSAPWWPGLSWEAGDAATGTQPTRQYIWLTHEASPVLFEEVGNFAVANPGSDYPAAQFVEAFTNDPFINTSNDLRTGTTAEFPVQVQTFNRKPTFFTINGQSGFFAHDHASITPMLRVGEPALVRVINAGLMTHSMHLHANHFYVTSINGAVQSSLLWIDVFNIYPMDCVDYVIPYHRPPDVPNARGIGRADAGLPALGGGLTWPPLQELDLHFPPLGTPGQSFADPNVTVELAQRLSPLCYPMHDHSEPTQTAQGGNYNCGLISGMYITGDRNGVMDFPMDPDFEMMFRGGGSTSATGPAAGNDILPDGGIPG